MPSICPKVHKLISLVAVLAALLGLLAVADIVIRHQVEDGITARVERSNPGAHASTTISSFPFVGRLAVSGTIPEMRVDATGVRAGPLVFSRVDLDLTDLRVRRGALLQRHVQLIGLRRGVITADISQESVDHLTGLPITFGAGTVGVGGVELPVQFSIHGSAVTIRFASLPSVTVPVPPLNLLPCVGAAVIVPGALQVSCSVTSLPSVLARATVGAL
ncbi:MAG TPA: hypothetical protein VG184_12440 [Acidimicrobiales bacterium]|nr:hypothetical protein [Acidimicrobiales bacterium]